MAGYSIRAAVWSIAGIGNAPLTIPHVSPGPDHAADDRAVPVAAKIVLQAVDARGPFGGIVAVIGNLEIVILLAHAYPLDHSGIVQRVKHKHHVPGPGYIPIVPVHQNNVAWIERGLHGG